MMIIIALALLASGLRATDGATCDFGTLLAQQAASQAGSFQPLSVSIPQGSCSVSQGPARVSLKFRQALFSGTSSQGRPQSQLDFGFLTTAALQLQQTDTRLTVQDVILSQVSLGPSLLQLQPLSGIDLVNLRNVVVTTDCWTLWSQQQLPAARTLSQGPGYLFFTNYTGPGVSAGNVNLTCDYWVIPTSAGLVLVANSSLSLYNSIVAASYFPAAPNTVQIQGDISISAQTFRQSVTLARSLNFTGMPRSVGSQLVNPMLDWANRQQLLLVNNPSVRVGFSNMDFMNLPQLRGVYLRGSGMMSVLSYPLWTVWYDPVKAPRNTAPVYLSGVTMVLPQAEFRWLYLFSVAVTSPLIDVNMEVAVLKSLFNHISINTSAPSGVVAFTNLNGAGLDARNLQVVAAVPSYVAFNRLPTNILMPAFNADVTKTPLMTTSINVVSASDLVLALTDLQNGPALDSQLNIVLWTSVSLADVQSVWPRAGFLIPTNLTITGPNASWYAAGTVIPKVVVDFSSGPYFAALEPAAFNNSRNTLSFAWLILLNMPTKAAGTWPPQLTTTSAAGLTTALCSNEDPWVALTMQGIDRTRTGVTAGGTSNLVFRDVTLVVPSSDWALLNGLVRAQGCAYASMTGPQQALGSCYFDTITTQFWQGVRTTVSYTAPDGFALQYPATLANISRPPPLLAPNPSQMVITETSEKGLATGAVIGIAVGVSVGAALLAALAVVLVMRRSHKKDGAPATKPPSVTVIQCDSKTDTAGSSDIPAGDSNSNGGDRSQHHSQRTSRASSRNPSRKQSMDSTRSTRSTKTRRKSGKRQSAGNLNAETIAAILNGQPERSTAGSERRNSAGGSSVASHVSCSQELQAELQQVMGALAEDIDDTHLELLEAVGQGGFGTVYKGKWKGLVVAVKTLTFQDRVLAGGKTQHTAFLEAAISTSITHPYVVATYSYDIKPLKVDADVQLSNLKVSSQVITDWKLYIIQEFCDAGSLRQAVIRQHMWDRRINRPDLRAVLECAIEFASGLAHLHKHNIIHGDLNPNNVLLKKHPSTYRGVVCKLCDFGLSIKMGDGQSHISNMRRGTPFYTAPEVMSKGNMTKAADSYSFGVMLWELYHSRTCYRVLPDRTFQQREEFPSFPSSCPFEYVKLAALCMADDVSKRPTMPQAVGILEAIAQKQVPQGVVRMKTGAGTPAE